MNENTKAVDVLDGERLCHCCGEPFVRCRETYRGTSAAVDVLAVIDELKLRFRNCRELAGFDEPSDLFAKADEARAAIAELIEAGKALQEAMDTPEKGPFDSLTVKQFHEADARHRAALIACGAVLAAVGPQS